MHIYLYLYMYVCLCKVKSVNYSLSIGFLMKKTFQAVAYLESAIARKSSSNVRIYLILYFLSGRGLNLYFSFLILATTPPSFAQILYRRSTCDHHQFLVRFVLIIRQFSIISFSFLAMTMSIYFRFINLTDSLESFVPFLFCLILFFQLRLQTPLL